MSFANKALHGKWIPSRLFSRHWGVILALVILIMIYITNRYQCITAMETIKTLEKELQVVKSERIREKSTYMTNIREMTMQQRIDSLGLGLGIRNEPPYKLDLK